MHFMVKHNELHPMFHLFCYHSGGGFSIFAIAERFSSNTNQLSVYRIHEANSQFLVTLF